MFGRGLKVTNLDKVLFPRTDPPVTKRELLAYAARIAPVALPYLEGRPLNLHRYPDGAGTAGFWHKQRPAHAPDWVGRWDNDRGRRGRDDDVRRARTNRPHWSGRRTSARSSGTRGRRAREPSHEPTYALIDLDPGETTRWDDLLVLARLHRTALDHLGVAARAKVTGRRGIQIWVPIVPGYSFDDTRAWVRRLSRTVGQVVPELVSWKWEVQAPQGAGPARLHPERDQQDTRRALLAHGPRPVHRCRCRSPGTSSTTRTSDPTDGPSALCWTV